MNTIDFEWDEKKNEKNKEKHKIGFEEALTVFYDENAVLFDDPEHSEDEDRFLIIGITQNERLCIVSHCYRGEQDDKIRIISARKATKNETRFYNEYNGGDLI